VTTLPTLTAPPSMPVWRVAHHIGCDTQLVLGTLNRIYGDYPDAEALVDGVLAETLIALGRADEHGEGEGDG
jgi:hypothetical protein